MALMVPHQGVTKQGWRCSHN